MEYPTPPEVRARVLDGTRRCTEMKHEAARIDSSCTRRNRALRCRGRRVMRTPWKLRMWTLRATTTTKVGVEFLNVDISPDGSEHVMLTFGDGWAAMRIKGTVDRIKAIGGLQVYIPNTKERVWIWTTKPNAIRYFQSEYREALKSANARYSAAGSAMAAARQDRSAAEAYIKAAEAALAALETT